MNSAEAIRRIAEESALDEANAGRLPGEQGRDATRLVRIVCAWCGKLIRHEMWPERKGGVLEENVSHGCCPVCARKLEASMTTLTHQEYWQEQRRLARMEERIEHLAEGAQQLEQGLAEQGHLAMELRARVQQLEAAIISKEDAITN